MLWNFVESYGSFSLDLHDTLSTPVWRLVLNKIQMIDGDLIRREQSKNLLVHRNTKKIIG